MTALAELTPRDVHEAVRLSRLLTDDQLAYWMDYGEGREHSVDAMGFGVELSVVGRAAFRHRIAVDPEAAAKCECWEGEPPAVALFKPAWRVTPSLKHPGWHVVIGPYDEGFIDELRLVVWPALRAWVPGMKAWRVHTRALPDTMAIIERHSLPVVGEP
jgi:hypothetical protein